MKFIFYTGACLMTCLFFIQNSEAKLIRFKHKLVGESKYSFTKVCETLLGKSVPLVQFKSIGELDCMGTIVRVQDYCIKSEAAKAYYTRALVSKKKQKVICQSAKIVNLKYECEGKKDPYCLNEKSGCKYFKKIMAYRLDLNYSYLNEEVKPRTLTCRFGDTGSTSLPL